MDLPYLGTGIWGRICIFLYTASPLSDYHWFCKTDIIFGRKSISKNNEDLMGNSDNLFECTGGREIRQ